MTLRYLAALAGAMVLSSLADRAWAAPPKPLENLARRATATATSEHNQHYQARFVLDGKIPAQGTGAADLDAAWCVLKARSGDQAELSLQWNEPVELAEVVYWGRTTWFINECWKDYQLYLGDNPVPAVQGQFKMIHGPQRVKFPKTRVARLRLKFLNSYGGFNPGALEIQAFSESLPDKQFARLMQALGCAVAAAPNVDETDLARLRQLIQRLSKEQASRYPDATGHLVRLDRLALARSAAEARGASGEEEVAAIDRDLERLEREVLLFDVDRIVAIRRHEIDASHVYTYHYEGFRPGGALCLVSLRDPDEKPVDLVASPTGQILDADLSYDGKTILFSWRQKQDEGYHVWKIHVDGTGLQRLTVGPWHDYNACWLPDGGIAFLSTRSPQFAYCWHAPVGILHRMNADGSGLRQLSANYLNDFTPYVLEDGRILYTRWEYVDRPAIPIQSLWTINPDGTGLAGYYGNRVLSPATFMDVRPIPGTTRILCTMTGHNGPARGAIGIVDRAKGVNAQAAIENLTPDVPVPKVGEGCGNFEGSKLYSCPCPLDSTRFLVSARGPLLVRTLSGDCQAIARSAPDEGMQWFAAQPVRPRFRPPVVAGKLPDQAEKMATVFLQDVYNGLEPYVARGEVKTLRVVRELPKTVRIDPSLRAFGFQFPVISCGATYAGKQVLGEVPIEADGSACFRVPSGIPIYFMALDAQGSAVQRMRSFTHLMPGEVQGCVGCHEHRLSVSRPQLSLAAMRPPRELAPPEWGVIGFDYSRLVQPVLDQHCANCHNPVDAPKRIDLSAGKTDFFNVSYECLARENQGGRGSPYVSWIPTYNGQEWNILQIQPKSWGSPASKLAEVLLSGHRDEQGKARVSLDEGSRRRILAWIDLNVPYYGSSETAYPERTGCRQILPEGLDPLLAEVGRRRCAECHREGKFPRREWVRITEPELNPFLLAPLAKSAGGSQRCGKAVFSSKDDPDYRTILAAFEPVSAMLRARPRMDMPGGKPAPDVCRSCK